MEPAHTRPRAAVLRPDEGADAVVDPPVLRVPSGSPLDEYKHLGEDLRHYGVLRLYRLTLLLGTTGAMITALASENVRGNAVLAGTLKVGGLVVALAFAIMDYRSGRQWLRLRRRANLLAGQLGFDGYPASHAWNPLTTTGATRALHAFVVLAWLWVLLLPLARST